MRSELIRDGDQISFAIVLDRGDEIVGSLEAFVREQGLAAGRFTAAGAFSYVVLGFFDWSKKDYERIHVDQPVQILSLEGEIILDAGKPRLHSHVVLAKPDGSPCSGQLLEGYVRPVLEIVIDPTVNSRSDAVTAAGLALSSA